MADDENDTPQPEDKYKRPNFQLEGIFMSEVREIKKAIDDHLGALEEADKKGNSKKQKDSVRKQAQDHLETLEHALKGYWARGKPKTSALVTSFQSLKLSTLIEKRIQERDTPSEEFFEESNSLVEQICGKKEKSAPGVWMPSDKSKETKLEDLYDPEYMRQRIKAMVPSLLSSFNNRNRVGQELEVFDCGKKTKGKVNTKQSDRMDVD